MTFTCEHCGGVFDRNPDWTDADETIEYQERFSEEFRADEGGPVRLCDYCYRLLLEIMASRGIDPK